MDYKLNLLTPCLYSQEGPSNCIDELVEEFADYIRHRAYNEFNFRCNYNKIPGLAFIHSFEDFENRFLIHSEYAVIIASPCSQKALNQFVPRLLVFLTAKPIWQSRLLFICLGEVKILSNLVVNDPIQFSLDNWEAKDEESWKSLFNLIKITWKPHIEEECLGHTLTHLSNPLIQKKSLKGNKDNTMVENERNTFQVPQKGEVRMFVSRAIQGPLVTFEKYIFVGNDCKANEDRAFKKSISVQTDNKYIEETSLLNNPDMNAKIIDYSNSSFESDENSDDNSEQTFECQPIMPHYLSPDIIEENDIELNSEMTTFFGNLNNSHLENKNRSKITANITNKSDDNGDNKMQFIGAIETTKQNPSDNVMEYINNETQEQLNTHEDDYLEKGISDTTLCQVMLNRDSNLKSTFQNLNKSLGVELENDELENKRSMNPLQDNQDVTDSHNILSKNNIEISKDENFFEKEGEENTKKMPVNETGLKDAFDICVREEKLNSPISDETINENNKEDNGSMITSTNSKKSKNSKGDYEEKDTLQTINEYKIDKEEHLVPGNSFIKETDFKRSVTSKQGDTIETKEPQDITELNIPCQEHEDVNNAVASCNLNDNIKDSDHISGFHYKILDRPILHNIDGNNNRLNRNKLELSDVIFEENDISKRIQGEEHETISLKTKLGNKLVWKQPTLLDMVTEEKDIYKTDQKQKTNEMVNSTKKLNNRLKWKFPDFSDLTYEEIHTCSNYQKQENNEMTTTISKPHDEKYSEIINLEGNRKSNKDSLKDNLSVVDKEYFINDDEINLEENKERETDTIPESKYETGHEFLKINKFIDPICNSDEEVGLIKKREDLINSSDINLNEQEKPGMDSIAKELYHTDVELSENHKDHRDLHSSNQTIESKMKKEKESHTNTLFNDSQPSADFQVSPRDMFYDNYSQKDCVPNLSSKDSNNIFPSDDTLNSYISNDTVQLECSDCLINNIDSISKKKSGKNELLNSDIIFERTGNSEIKSHQSNTETAGKDEIKSSASDKISKTPVQVEDQLMELIAKGNGNMSPVANIGICIQSKDSTKSDFEVNTVQSVDLDSHEKKNTGYLEHLTQVQHDKTEDQVNLHKDKNNNAEISKGDFVSSKNLNNNILDKFKEFNSQKIENINANLSNIRPIQLECSDTSFIEKKRNVKEDPLLSFKTVNDQFVLIPNRDAPVEYVSKETCLKEKENVKNSTTANTYHKQLPIYQDVDIQSKPSIQEELNTKLKESFLDSEEEFFKANIKSENEYYNPDECDKNLREKENTLENLELIQNSTHDEDENTVTSLRVFEEENQFRLWSSFQLFTDTFEFAQHIHDLSRDFTFSVFDNIRSTFLNGTRPFLRNWLPHNSRSIAQSDESQMISQKMSLIESLYSPWCVLLVFIAGTLISPYWVSFTNGHQPSGSSLFFMNPISLSVLQDKNNRNKFPFHRKFNGTFFAYGLTVYKKDSKK